MKDIYEKLLAGEAKVAVIGLGYVGMPLAIAFSKKVPTIGYDINYDRVAAYRRGEDPTGELNPEDLQHSALELTTDETKLGEASFFIIAVPTPDYDDKRPKLEAVEDATRSVGRQMNKGAVIVYESTVYPGVTEDLCIPILEKFSQLRMGDDFKLGYSPERINPGDKVHRVENITKVVAGSDGETTDLIAKVYDLVIEAGTFKAASIKVAEAVKLVENAQRDVNIAFMNEVSMYFNLIGIDTKDVLAGMATKWNALNFEPGLVGGHCIGIDPYYFIYQSEKMGYAPEIIVSSRKLNDSMGYYVADKTILGLIQSGRIVREAKAAVFGATFKENCPDIRNAKTKDIIVGLERYGMEVKLNDPAAWPDDVRARYGKELTPVSAVQNMDVLIFAVAHQEYKELSDAELQAMLNLEDGKPAVIIDVKRIFDRQRIEALGHYYWGL